MIPQIDWTNVKAALLAVAFALVGLLAWATFTHRGPIEAVNIGPPNERYTIKDPGVVHITKAQIEKLERTPIVIVPAPPPGVSWSPPVISIP